MHTWAKRGLQTAVVTGGLFAIGSGIASASENVTPAAPAELTGPVTSVPGNTVSGVVGQLAGRETPVKAVPVVSLFDSGAMSAPVKTVQDALGRVPAKADPTDVTEIHGFSGDLLDPTPGLPSVQSRPSTQSGPSTQALGLPFLPATPALPAVGAGGLTGLEQTLPLGSLTAGNPMAAGGALTAPVLAQVTRTVLNSGGLPDASALDMPLGSIGLLRATELPSLPLPVRSSLPGGMAEQDAPAVPALPAVPAVPAGLPVGLPKPNVQLPEVSALRGELPVNALSGALPGAPSEQDLPTAGLPAVPAVPAVPGLTGVTLPSLPKVPALPAAGPALPAVPGHPAVQDGALPNGLALPNLPKVPFLPEAPALPAANAAASNFLSGMDDQLPGI